MKTTVLVLSLMACGALVVGTARAQENGTQWQQSTTVPAGGAAVSPPALNSAAASFEAGTSGSRWSGPLERIFSQPRKALDLINPFSNQPLSYRQQPTQPRSFVDPVTHEPGLVLARFTP